MKLNKAIPCGLIINELLSNSLKHAFAGKEGGEITVVITYNDKNRCTLTVSDNGVGIPESFDIMKTNTLGLKLVTNLVKQLVGTVELDRTGGTTYKIIFST